MSHYSGQNYTAETDPAEIFAGGGSCLLNPEATEGPFCESSTPVSTSAINKCVQM
ncbi:hypothetical protein IMZ48_16015 [Candidatus Bathyarchaeota archaeon]|nr:hypothetical protein [Candidatus Bathyarchaeota archaeon]